MIIDANMYWLPQTVFRDSQIRHAFLRAIPEESDTRIVEAETDKFIVERPIGYPSLNYERSDYCLDKQLADMETANIAQGVLKLPGCQEWLSLELCRHFNDELAQQVQASNGRLVGLAVVPPFGDEESLAELVRSIETLNLNGVQVSAHYGELYLDDPVFRPFFRKVNELQIPVYVHHTPVPVDYQSLYQYDNLRRSLGRNIDQLTAIGREVFSDLFEELPDLVLIHSMMGGGITAFQTALFPEGSGNGRFDNRTAYKERFQKNIYLEMSHAQPWGVEGLETAVKVIGADRVIYGSSYPVKDSWFSDGPEFVSALAIDDETKQKLLYQNATQLYRLTGGK